MAERNGVDIALDKAGGGPEAYKILASLFAPPISVPAIYRFRRKGWFPIERAKIVAEKYGIPLHELVRDDIREALLTNNNS